MKRKVFRVDLEDEQLGASCGDFFFGGGFQVICLTYEKEHLFIRLQAWNSHEISVCRKPRSGGLTDSEKIRQVGRNR